MLQFYLFNGNYYLFIYLFVLSILKLRCIILFSFSFFHYLTMKKIFFTQKNLLHLSSPFCFNFNSFLGKQEKLFQKKKLGKVNL